MYLVYNSVLLPISDLSIRPDDRGFRYGDGLFETLRCQHNGIAFWPDHYDRLTRGMAALHLDRPDTFTPDALQAQIITLLQRNGLTDMARVNIHVWRQPGGLYTPTSRSAHILITAKPGQPFSVGETVNTGIFGDVRLSASPVSPYKTISALPYVLAGLARQTGGFDDMVLLDTHGHVAECVASALFWFRDDTLFAPSLATGCIDGILRRQLLRLAPGAGFQVQEGLFFPEDLTLADAVFCGNVMGIQRLLAINGMDVNEKKPLRAGVEQKLNELFARFG